jgi:Fe-S-cluster containining protein
MSVGRNDPCPCGSGLKFKKCCLNKQTPSVAPRSQLSAFDFISLFAYAGQIGRQREAWCKEFFAWKTMLESEMGAGQQLKAEEKGEKITCSKGCWYCCTQFVGASLQECEAIVHWLYRHHGAFEIFLNQYPIWRRRVRKNEELFQKITLAGNTQLTDPSNRHLQRAFLETSAEFAKLDIPCPFLFKGECSIYPARPFACISQVSISPPEYCKQSVEEIPFLIIVDSTYRMAPYFYGKRENMTFGPAALFTYEIMKNGYAYLNAVPGLAGIEDAALSDPEIVAIIRDNIARLK